MDQKAILVKQVNLVNLAQEGKGERLVIVDLQELLVKMDPMGPRENLEV